MTQSPVFRRVILDTIPGTLACGAVLTVVLAVAARLMGAG